MTTVSVIVTTHKWARYGEFRDAVQSIEAQTYDDVELVCPFDGDGALETATEAIADGGIVSDTDAEKQGLSAARNRGAEMANGDVYAFIDDDCVAAPHWVSTLVDAFDDGALAAGGPAVPEFSGDRPWYLTEDWDWLVGGGPYHDGETTVRNTYGCNLAFDADVFDYLGGFDESLGKDDDLRQGEEAELCQRLREEVGAGVQYRPEARVRHRVFPEQTSIPHLVKRAYYQGVSKRQVGLDDEETGFLGDIARSLVRKPPHQSVAALALTAATGLGFLRGSA